MMQMEERPAEGKKRCRNMSQPLGTIIHIASSTDSLSSIAAQYDTSISMLRRINKLMTDLIYPQQILYIPKEDFIFTNALSSNLGQVSPSAPRPLSEDEMKQIDEECHHKFVKFKTKYIAKDKSIIDGVLLITPDGVMFDPSCLNHSPEFQLVDSIMSVISVAVYHNKDSTLNLSKLSDKSSPKTESKVNSETMKKMHSRDDINFFQKDLINVAPKNKLEDTNDKCVDKIYNVINEPLIVDKNIKASDDIDIVKNDQNLMICDNFKVDIAKNAIVNKEIKITDNVDISDKDTLQKTSSSAIVDFIPTNQNDDAMTLHLCLKVHKNFDAVHAHSFRGVQNKSHIRHEYWYILPYDKNIDHMFAFFKRWSPSQTNTNDSTEFYFVEIDSSNVLFEQISDSLVKDWEIVSLKEYQRLQNILEVKKLPPPTLLQQSYILMPNHVQSLSCNMPPLVEGMSWQLCYSTEEHGISLHTMYRKLSTDDLACLIIIADSNECVFGAVIVGSIKITDHYSGSGESYLFTFQPDFKRYDWTGVNNFFVKGSKECLCIGASEGNNGLWLNEDLFHGRSQTCQTFDNEPLSKTEDFIIKCLEVWRFV